MMVGGCGLVWDQSEIGIAEGPLVFPLADILQRPHARGANTKHTVEGPYVQATAGKDQPRCTLRKLFKLGARSSRASILPFRSRSRASAHCGARDAMRTRMDIWAAGKPYGGGVATRGGGGAVGGG